MKNILLIILFVAIAVISALFFAKNDDLVSINYFVASIHWPMNWVLITAILLGFFLGIASMLGSFLSNKIKLANANRRLTELKKEISNLRSLPLKDDY